MTAIKDREEPLGDVSEGDTPKGRPKSMRTLALVVIGLVAALGIGVWAITVDRDNAAETTLTTPQTSNDAEFLEWANQNGLQNREGDGPARFLDAVENRAELEGVRLMLFPTLLSSGVYAHQVRVEGAADICGRLEGLFKIDGNIGEFLNDVFPAPDEMNVGASRPYFPYICKPDPQPGTIDAVLVAPFDMILEPGALTLSNSGGTVRFVVSDE